MIADIAAAAALILAGIALAIVGLVVVGTRREDRATLLSVQAPRRLDSLAVVGLYVRRASADAPGSRCGEATRPAERRRPRLMVSKSRTLCTVVSVA